MQPLKLFVLFFLFISPNLNAQIFPDLNGQALLDQLVATYKPVHVLSYSDARDTMYAVIYNVEDSVRGVYSDHALYLPPNVDPSQFLHMNGSANGINAEHAWPRSKGASEENGNAFSDLHHLFPARAAVNESRSNFPFAEIPDISTQKWFYKTQALTSVPANNIDKYSERANGRFEPKEDQKGNVARAMFYFYTMYKAEADDADPGYFEIQRQALCQWHYQDPADQLEEERNWLIASYQDGKPNPYILDCTLAARTFCGDVPPSCPLTNIFENNGNNIDIAISPNPANNEISLSNIPGQPAYSMAVYSVLGQKILFDNNWDNGPINIGKLIPGQYFIILKNNKKTYSGRFVKN
ncbi:MAG TPA: T9SS type A sorting domain-containing protein [Bacteroidetes bacterium]|nr:T9SS type A sorting domain-containing protein [Bacteroidota bacterium]